MFKSNCGTTTGCISSNKLPTTPAESPSMAHEANRVCLSVSEHALARHMQGWLYWVAPFSLPSTYPTCSSTCIFTANVHQGLRTASETRLTSGGAQSVPLKLAVVEASRNHSRILPELRNYTLIFEYLISVKPTQQALVKCYQY